MINLRYKKLTGMHVGHVFKVMEPASELEAPLTWTLHAESVPDERLTVSEDELADPKRWQPLA